VWSLQHKPSVSQSTKCCVTKCIEREYLYTPLLLACMYCTDVLCLHVFVHMDRCKAQAQSDCGSGVFVLGPDCILICQSNVWQDVPRYHWHTLKLNWRDFSSISNFCCYHWTTSRFISWLRTSVISGYWQCILFCYREDWILLQTKWHSILNFTALISCVQCVTEACSENTYLRKLIGAGVLWEFVCCAKLYAQGKILKP